MVMPAFGSVNRSTAGIVIPAKAGIQSHGLRMDPRGSRDDGFDMGCPVRHLS